MEESTIIKILVDFEKRLRRFASDGNKFCEFSYHFGLRDSLVTNIYTTYKINADPVNFRSKNEK